MSINTKYIGKGYANIHKKNSNMVIESKEKKPQDEILEKENVEGKIKIINKENLKNLLLD